MPERNEDTEDSKSKSLEQEPKLDDDSQNNSDNDVPEPLSYPSKPKFAVMEHSMDVAGHVLYERREAHIYRKEDDKQYLIVLIVRSIDDRVIKTIVKRLQGEEDVIEDVDEVDDKDKRDFFERWAQLWIPRSPDEDNASPTMLEIAHIEPYPIMYPTEEPSPPEGAEPGKVERDWKHGDNPNEDKEAGKDQPLAKKKKKRKMTAETKKLNNYEKEMDQLEEEFRNLRSTERRLRNKLADVKEDEEQIMSKVDQLQRKLTASRAQQVQAEAMSRGYLDNLLKKLESEVLNAKSVEEKMKHAVNDIMTEEKQLQESVKNILGDIRNIQQEDEKTKLREQDAINRLQHLRDVFPVKQESPLPQQNESVNSMIQQLAQLKNDELKNAVRDYEIKRLKSVVYRSEDDEKQKLPDGGERIKFRANITRQPKPKLGSDTSDRENAEKHLRREEKKARKSLDEDYYSPSRNKRRSARRRRKDDRSGNRSRTEKRGRRRDSRSRSPERTERRRSRQKLSPSYPSERTGRARRRSPSRSPSRPRRIKYSRESPTRKGNRSAMRSQTRRSSPRRNADSNFSKTVSGGETGRTRAKASTRSRYDTSISRKGVYNYGEAKAKTFAGMKNYTIYKPKTSVDLDKSTNTSMDTSKKSNHSQITIQFVD